MKFEKIDLLKNYYFISVLIYFSAIYLTFIRVGLFMSFILVLASTVLYYKKKFLIRKGLDVLVIFYIIYNIFSFVFFTFSGLPYSVFFKEFSNSILPIIPFYFFGRLNYQNSFYNTTLYALAGCFLVGFYFYFTLPYNYMFFMNKIDGTGTNPIGYTINYHSILGITATGSLGAISLLLSLGKLYNSKFKKGKIIFLICLVALVLSFRRAALYTGLFAILWFNYLIIFKFKSQKFKILFFELFIVLISIYKLLEFNPEFLDDLYERFNSFSDAIDSRSGSWFAGLSHTKSFITGDGLGRYGHKAVEFSNLYIPDGNYFRMIAELGFVGFSIFLLIIFNAIKLGIYNLKDNYINICIIIMVCLQAVGSDMFSFQIVAPLFWFAIGSCNKITN
ncbi:oligosaccharide repeat unit polymerase [Polaribacter dokdonensis]|nr:oligosaccharide repeat unit polymerase [Polaribacter dokdonensis]